MPTCVPAYVPAYVPACPLTLLFALLVAHVVHEHALGERCSFAQREEPSP